MNASSIEVILFTSPGTREDLCLHTPYPKAARQWHLPHRLLKAANKVTQGAQHLCVREANGRRGEKWPEEGHWCGKSREPARKAPGQSPARCRGSWKKQVCWSVSLHGTFRKLGSWPQGQGQGQRQGSLPGASPSALPTAWLAGVGSKDKPCDWPLC